ncbi:hypothetical protein ACH42_03885 [Endozoicomonas sp. (ex Bugula neritina AB1)]|nr:hypothetical protein ACH42_03885 [Endozoicomonas sp. (ex Bugula neritina AB1)]
MAGYAVLQLLIICQNPAAIEVAKTTWRHPDTVTAGMLRRALFWIIQLPFIIDLNIIGCAATTGVYFLRVHSSEKVVAELYIGYLYWLLCDICSGWKLGISDTFLSGGCGLWLSHESI